MTESARLNAKAANFSAATTFVAALTFVAHIFALTSVPPSP